MRHLGTYCYPANWEYMDIVFIGVRTYDVQIRLSFPDSSNGISLFKNIVSASACACFAVIPVARAMSRYFAGQLMRFMSDCIGSKNA